MLANHFIPMGIIHRHLGRDTRNEAMRNDEGPLIIPDTTNTINPGIIAAGISNIMGGPTQIPAAAISRRAKDRVRAQTIETTM